MATAKTKKRNLTDTWIAEQPLAKPGTEKIIRDAGLRRLRLVIKPTKKVYEIQAERPFDKGPRQTFVRVIGEAPMMSIEDARVKAAELLKLVAAGSDISVPRQQTLADAWARFEKRDDIGERTMVAYRSLYKKLAPLAKYQLAILSDQPNLAKDLHKEITDKKFPSEADHAMRLLRSIYRWAARTDKSLAIGKGAANGKIMMAHPCTDIKWNAGKPNEGRHPDAPRAADKKYLPPELMPAWATQLEKLRASNPWRASYQMLNLRCGTRPRELARAKWADIDFEQGDWLIPISKVLPYEIPLCPQIIDELERLRDIMTLMHPGSPYLFPPAFAQAKWPRMHEPATTLSHSGSDGRTTHFSTGSALGIDERVLNVLQGRSIKTSGALAAGRHYLSRIALGPAARQAQIDINNRLDELFAG